MLKLIKYLKKYKRQCILGPFFKLTEAVFELIVPLVMAKIIDVGIKNNDTSYIIIKGGTMVALGIVGFSVAIIAQYFAAQASQGFGTEVRNDMFSHIQNLSNSEIGKFGTPTLITRITNDINQLQIGVAMTIRQLLRAPFLIVGAIIMAFFIDVKLTAIFLIATPVIALIIYFIMSRCVPYFKKMQKTLDKISLITRENLSGVRVIRAFSKQKSEQTRFKQTNDEYKNTAIRVGKISALLNPLTYVVLNTAIIAIIWFGGKKVYDGRLTQGELIALINYLTQILFALIMLANLVVIYMKSYASGIRVIEVLDTKSSVIEGTQLNNSIKADMPKIQYKDVTFYFENSSEPALSNINLSILKGETIGIIGGTGCGKSTLINLILRFFDVTRGELLIDGINIKNYNFESLRNQIGLVPQNAMLFSGTIRENIKWGKPDATDDEIYKSLEIAQAKEFVDLCEDGLDKLIVQKGKNLSGGQKQRLTIARAIISNPQILILDDSASALDFATDAKLRKAISNLNKDLTVIIVSQRATSIKNADKIVVLDNGKIEGLGTNEELYSSCEVYQEICNSQLSEGES